MLNRTYKGESFFAGVGKVGTDADETSAGSELAEARLKGSANAR